MSNVFQKGLSFRNVEDILDYLPEDERKIVEALRTTILSCIPDCTEKISYNVPFYSRHKNICYLWPSSIPWGGIKSGVSLGFTKGMLFPDQKLFKKSNKKNVRSLAFLSLEEIDFDLISSLLYEAILIDEAHKKNYPSKWKDNLSN